jgi:hypothetical protein
MKKFLYIVGGFFVFLICIWLLRFQIAGFFLSESTGKLEAKYRNMSPEPALTKYFAEITEDAKMLEKYPVFAATGGQKDAAEFLNPIVSWSAQGEEISGKLRLSDEIKKKLLTAKKVAELNVDWKKINLDFSWFAKLHEYDHWNFDNSGPLYGKDKDYIISLAPIPDYVELTNWAELRLLKGRDDHDLATAFKDVEHLARLVFSNESLVSSMTTIALLGKIRRTYDSLDEKLKKGLPEPITRDFHQRAKRYFYAQGAFTDLRLSDETYKKLSIFPAAICQRINSAIESYIGLRNLMMSDFKTSFERINQLIAQTSPICRSGFLRQKWSDPKYNGMFKPGADIFLTVDPNSTVNRPAFFPATTIEDIEAHPKVARFLAYMLMSLSEPSWLRAYEEKN